jgi:plastocyanin
MHKLDPILYSYSTFSVTMNIFAIVAILIVPALLLLTTSFLDVTTFNTAIASPITKTSTQVTEIKVNVGGGNATAPWDTYLPQNLEIKVGQNVTWLNPSVVAEPHTVTFVLDPNTMTGVVSPFAVANTTKFTPIPPGSNNEPVIVPGESGNETYTIIGINARVFNPVAIDSQDNVKFMNPNANYEMSGKEKYVNSGWLLPSGLEQQYPGSGNTFTITFESPGTYGYLCLLHPWMTGSVIVKP